MEEIIDYVCAEHYMNKVYEKGKYVKQQHIVIKKQSQLYKMMSDEMKELFDDYEDEVNHMNFIAHQDVFRQGMKFATDIFLGRL